MYQFVPRLHLLCLLGPVLRAGGAWKGHCVQGGQLCKESNVYSCAWVIMSNFSKMRDGQLWIHNAISQMYSS